MKKIYLLFHVVGLLLVQSSFAQAPTITSLSPARNQRSAPVATNVDLTFSQPVSSAPATLNALRVFSAQRGGQLQNGTGGVTTANGNTLTFNPANDFRPGETIFTTITSAAQSSDGTSLARGQVHQFTTAVGGTGRGNFLPGGDYPINFDPEGIATGDIDGDGDLDVLTASRSANSISVLLNNGLGVFGEGSTIPLGAQITRVKLGDVDGDNDLDFVASTEFGYTIVRLNNGSGAFSGGSNVPVITNAYDLALGDVDADGDLDLLVSNFNGPSVSVRLNDGTGLFSGGSDVPVSPRPSGVVVGDIDGDGDLDFLSCGRDGNLISVRLNDGNGSFTGSQELSPGADPMNVVLGDVDGDGDLDAVSANRIGNSFSLFRNDGQGTFTLDNNLPGGGTSNDVDLADVDADGDLDLLGLNQTGGTVALWLNNGTGTFTLTQSIGGGCLFTLTTGDVDGDGDVDFLTANRSDCNSISVRFNQAQNPTISVVNPPVNTATVGAYFSQTFYALGGASPYSYSVVSSNLPTSLSLSASGVLSGTPAQTGNYSLVVQARDANGIIGVGTTYTLTVNPSDCGDVIYVTQNGAGSQDGSSWNNAFAGTALQTAINRAASCGAQVWVAQGLYKPTTGTDRTVSFSMKEGVAIYGGFRGTENQLDDRPGVNPVTGQPSSSTLSGDIGNPGDEGQGSDNSFHLFVNSSVLSNRAILDGFVLTKASATYDENGPARGYGGAIYTSGSVNSSSPSIRNCLFVKNFADNEGGAIYTLSSSLTTDNCRFESNTGNGRGGAMAFSGGGNPVVRNSSFLNNFTYDAGGAFYIDGPVNLTVQNSTIRTNQAYSAGVLYAYGNNGSRVEFIDCLMEGHEVGYGGVMNTQGYTDVLLTRCQFLSNKATDGESGVLYIGQGSLTATDCLFKNNSATGEAGAIYCQGDSMKLTNCIFQDNSSQDIGGALSVNCPTTLINCSFIGNTANQGGAIYCSDLTITNCSFLANQASQGGAICSEGTNVQLTNSVLWNNGGANSIAYPYGGDQVSASYSLFDATVTGYTDGGNNLTTTVTPFASTTSTELRNCSPAINTGSNAAYSAANGPAADLGGNARLYNGGIIDRGAYEYQGNPTTLTVVNPTVTVATVNQPFSQPFTAQGGSGPYSYSVVSSNLPASLSVSSAGVLSGTPTTAGSYSVLVTASDANGCSGTGTAYELTVRNTTSFTVVQAPANQTACVGSSVTFSVRVTPEQGVTYAWYKNSADPRQPVQATTPDYTVEVTDGGKAGRYIVRITGADGSTVEQRELYLTVNQRPVPPPPTSTRRQLCPDATPVNLSQYVSRTNNSYTVRYYQASGQLLPSSSVVLDQPGTYPFMVTQFDPATGCESVPTSFTLTVNTTTQLLANPTSQTACSGSNVTLTVQATGTNLKYEWFRGSVANQNKLAENASRQTGTTTASLTLVKVSKSEPYYVRVTGECGVVVSPAIAVTVQACGARQGVTEPAEQPLQVTVLGNPTESEWVDVVLAGAGSESVRLSVSDEQGHLISEQHLNAPQATGRQRVHIGQAAGRYFLQVSTATRRQTVKLLKR